MANTQYGLATVSHHAGFNERELPLKVDGKQVSTSDIPTLNFVGYIFVL